MTTVFGSKGKDVHFNTVESPENIARFISINSFTGQLAKNCLGLETFKLYRGVNYFLLHQSLTSLTF